MMVCIFSSAPLWGLETAHGVSQTEHWEVHEPHGRCFLNQGFTLKAPTPCEVKGYLVRPHTHPPPPRHTHTHTCVPPRARRPLPPGTLRPRLARGSGNDAVLRLGGASLPSFSAHACNSVGDQPKSNPCANTRPRALVLGASPPTESGHCLLRAPGARAAERPCAAPGDRTATNAF